MHDSSLHHRKGGSSAGGRGDVGGIGRTGVGGDAEIDTSHAEGVAFAVDGDVERVAVEKADAVEVFCREVVDVCAKSAEDSESRRAPLWADMFVLITITLSVNRSP